ncbi:hypothetical protein [Shewanella gaetbuli]|uniref:Uncharacterized protein n=1 Tax=Shewanella gaetbuli TaxID=220752 RepID=A0A9X2CLW2_9GAMM|nr:hypothetical protein [Shewanella gaetbuli]MCL1143030.1 hypothetical protein [Shewanella gaetbuli]
MHQHIFNHPQVIQISKPTLMKVRLAENVDDLLILACLSNPLFELLISQIEGSTTTLLIRQQPFIDIEYEQTIVLAEHYDVCRTEGQGVRLYSRMAVAPRLCIEQLRQGIDILVQADKQVFLSCDASKRHELIPLELDLRLLSEPEVLVIAKSILGHTSAFEQSSAMLAIQISEIEQVRRDIREYMRGESGKIHPGVSTELLKLDHLLQNKHQWLLRSYHQSLERPNLSNASNEPTMDIEKLEQKLACYNVLAPSDVTELVNQLLSDEL